MPDNSRLVGNGTTELVGSNLAVIIPVTGEPTSSDPNRGELYASVPDNAQAATVTLQGTPTQELNYFKIFHNGQTYAEGALGAAPITETLTGDATSGEFQCIAGKYYAGLFNAKEEIEVQFDWTNIR